MAQGKALEEEVSIRGQGRPERRDRPKDVNACSLASTYANVNDFLAQTRY
jgi:hypothetical protein